MRSFDERLEHIFIVVLFTIFMGQFYLSPFGSGFRLTFAVVAVTLTMLHFKDVPVQTTSVIIAVLMFMFRTMVYSLTYPGTPFFEAVQIYFPVIIYYVIFGFMFQLLDVRMKRNSPLSLYLAIFLCDVVPNFAEILLRQEWQGTNVEEIIYAILLMGIIRSLITTILFFLFTSYIGRQQARDRVKKYREAVIFNASLNSELFLLKKSKSDIENAMQLSYELYEYLQEEPNKDKALVIAKEIHEIKKDYSRVISGIEGTLDLEGTLDVMSFSDLINIIVTNTYKLMSDRGLDIEIYTRINKDFSTSEFYQVISILNNLVINAIESIGQSGSIIITEDYIEDNYVITVQDDGPGIEDNDLDLIFEPGFSTKYNENTGNMNNGIGLTHVKNLVENYFDGVISIESEYKDTSFTVELPKENLVRGAYEL